ncbi:MAG: PAS domain S-box protein [Sulfuricella sp.]
MPSTINQARTVAWLVAFFVGVIVLAVPAGYSYVTYRYMAGSLESETDVIARAITQNIISRNPVYWEFEKVRMEEYFARLTPQEVAEGGRIFNQKNEVVAEVTSGPALPVITRSHTLTDAGVVVGHVEVSRSLRPMIMRTTLLGLVVIAAGLGLFAILWYLPIHSLYQAQNLASQSELRYRGVFEYAEDIIYLLAPDGVFNSLSPSFERVTGWHPQEWVGKPFAPIIHPDDLPRALEVFRKALSGQSTPVFELRIAKKSGEYFDSELSIVPVNPGGEIAAIGIARDVTARKQAQEEIRKQQELTSLIIETIPMRVFWKDRDLRYMGCNTLFAKDAGLNRPAELIGKSDFDMGWKDQAELYRADDQRVMDSNISKLSYDEPQTTPDGRKIWLRSSKVPLVNEANESIGVLGVYEDITEHKLAAQTLEESELKFRTILDSAVDGILVAEGEAHKFVIANHAICDMLGYSLEEIYRLGLEDIHPADALSHVRKQFERQMKGEVQVASNLPVKRKDGSVFYADVSSSPMVLVGRPYLIGVFHDVTERRQVEEKVRELNEELEEKVRERTQQLLTAQEDLVRKEKLAVLGQVAGSVGHELRNPLGVMNNAVYFLQTVLSDGDDTVKEYLAMIKEEITGAERIVSDLLDSVRTKPPQPEAVGVAELIGQVLRSLSVPATVAVQLDIPATLPPLQVDPLQVQQVFRNLINNGIDAMAQGGTLEIRATEADEGKAIAVSVRDTGCGIVPAQMARLFQPLFTTKARGIGLGLVVVKNLTEANGGRIEVRSEPGKGTVFSVTLPSVSSPAEEA